MKNLACIFTILLAFASVVYAQSSADDYTRQSTAPPDLYQGTWRHDPTQDQRSRAGVLEYYVNTEENLIAYLFVISKGDVREEVYMDYGSPNVGRSAIKINSQWYIGKGPFYDSGKDFPEYDLKFEMVVDPNNLGLSQRISLDTVDGFKEVIVKY